MRRGIVERAEQAIRQMTGTGRGIHQFLILIRCTGDNSTDTTGSMSTRDHVGSQIRALPTMEGYHAQSGVVSRRNGGGQQWTAIGSATITVYTDKISWQNAWAGSTSRRFR
jgi:hypothetical protein